MPDGPWSDHSSLQHTYLPNYVHTVWSVAVALPSFGGSIFHTVHLYFLCCIQAVSDRISCQLRMLTRETTTCFCRDLNAVESKGNFAGQCLCRRRGSHYKGRNQVVQIALSVYNSQVRRHPTVRLTTHRYNGAGREDLCYAIGKRYVPCNAIRTCWASFHYDVIRN